MSADVWLANLPTLLIFLGVLVLAIITSRTPRRRGRERSGRDDP